MVVKSKIESINKVLEIDNISIVESHTKTAENLFIKYSGKIRFKYKIKDKVLSVSTIEALSDDGKPFDFCIFSYNFICELFSQEGDKEDNDKPLCKIDTTYNISYKCKEKCPDVGNMEEFARFNVPHHLWPYWREHVQSTLSKCHFPQITLPMRHFEYKSDD